MDMVQPFSVGQVIWRREILDGREWIAYPVRVAVDTVEVLGVYLAQGTSMRFGQGAFRWGPHPWAEIGRTWQSEGVLQVQRPGDAYAVWIFRGQGMVTGCYVNFQDPFRRGLDWIDTLDHELDIWVPADGGVFRWKDVEEFEQRARSGGYSIHEAEAVRAESRKVVELIEAGNPWWTQWTGWRAPDDWRTLDEALLP